MTNQTNQNPKKVGFYLQTGVEILDMAGPMEVFVYAGYEVFTISKHKEPILVQDVMKVIPDYTIEDAPPANILAFFGGNGQPTSKDKTVIDWLKKQTQTQYYFSVCSGATILAEAGILDGLKATTFRETLDYLEENFPKVEVLRDTRYVDNGLVVTTAGVSAGIDGALHMVAKLEGLAEAGKAAFYMEYEWVPNRGLDLSKEQPYSHMHDVQAFQDYVGQYFAEGHQVIEVCYWEAEQSLAIIKSGKLYKIFYLDKDVFLASHASHWLTFERDNNEKVAALHTSEAKGVQFVKHV